MKMLGALYPRDGDEYDRAMQEAKDEYQAWEAQHIKLGKSITVFSRKQLEESNV